VNQTFPSGPLANIAGSLFTDVIGYSAIGGATAPAREAIAPAAEHNVNTPHNAAPTTLARPSAKSMSTPESQS